MEKFQCYYCGFMVKKKGYLSQHHKKRSCINEFNKLKHQLYQANKFLMNLNDINEFNNLTQKDYLISFLGKLYSKNNL
jgi:hypothetical protein